MFTYRIHWLAGFPIMIIRSINHSRWKGVYSLQPSSPQTFKHPSLNLSVAGPYLPTFFHVTFSHYEPLMLRISTV